MSWEDKHRLPQNNSHSWRLSLQWGGGALHEARGPQHTERPSDRIIHKPALIICLSIKAVYCLAVEAKYVKPTFTFWLLFSRVYEKDGKQRSEEIVEDDRWKVPGSIPRVRSLPSLINLTSHTPAPSWHRYSQSLWIEASANWVIKSQKLNIPISGPVRRTWCLCLPAETSTTYRRRCSQCLSCQTAGRPRGTEHPGNTEPTQRPETPGKRSVCLKEREELLCGRRTYDRKYYQCISPITSQIKLMYDIVCQRRANIISGRRTNIISVSVQLHHKSN